MGGRLSGQVGRPPIATDETAALPRWENSRPIVRSRGLLAGSETHLPPMGQLNAEERKKAAYWHGDPSAL